MGLSYIGRIKKLEVIENADSLLSAVVACEDGGTWRGVVRKDVFSTGDRVTVFLQDAIVPKLKSLAFMEKHRWRVKMQRLRGAPSECLITELLLDGDVGECLDKRLGVEKYEKPVPAELGGQVAGRFPSFIRKTDEVHYQKLPEVIKYLYDVPVYITEKFDGSSGTVFKSDDIIGVCSRNYELKETDTNTFWRLIKNWNLHLSMPEGYALQFELYGEGIQGNPLGIKGFNGAAFNLWNIEEQKYEDAAVLKVFCEDLEVPMATRLEWDFRLEESDYEYLQSLAAGTYLGTNRQREGVVIRAMREHNIRGQRASVKVMNLDYKNH